MPAIKTSKVFKNGQITIPVAIRDLLDIKPSDEIVWTVDESDAIIVRKVPTKADWDKLFSEANIPVEVIKTDEDGKYDPKQAPAFHNWMING